jgi:pimeloyl-ACP methyl ester carboxylesterase
MLVLVCGLLTGVSLAQDELGVFVPEECPMLDVPSDAVVDCGYVIVPEDYDDPDGNWVYLAVAIIRAEQPGAQADPIMYLEGGPGGSAIAGVDFWYDAQIGDNRDIILLDQRGTGYSDPYLGCEWFDYDDEILDAEDVIYYTECSALFEDEEFVLLDQYNSANTAKDIAMVMDALDIPQINLYGISYGTRVALTMMRDFPERLRSVVLDSPYPPHIAGFDDQAPNGYAAISGVLNACTAQADCAATFPDLPARLEAYLLELEDSPLIYDFGDGEYDYSGGDMASLVFDVLYDTSAIPYLPFALDALISGDPEPLTILYYGELVEQDGGGMSEAMDDFDEEDYEDYSDADLTFYIVECNEEYPFNSIEQARVNAASIPEAYRDGLLDPIIAAFELCEALAIAPADPIETAPVVSNVPTLVLTGQFDPITPPVYGQETVSTLSRGQWINIPFAGHSQIDAGDCPVLLGVSFINNPTETLDTSCVAGMPVRFALSLDE